MDGLGLSSPLPGWLCRLRSNGLRRGCTAGLSGHSFLLGRCALGPVGLSALRFSLWAFGFGSLCPPPFLPLLRLFFSLLVGFTGPSSFRSFATTLQQRVLTGLPCNIHWVMFDAWDLVTWFSQLKCFKCHCHAWYVPVAGLQGDQWGKPWIKHAWMELSNLWVSYQNTFTTGNKYVGINCDEK